MQLGEYNQQEPPDLDPTFTDDFDYDVMQYLYDDNEQEEYTLEAVRQSNDSRAPDSPITIYYDGGGLSSDSDTDTAQAPVNIYSPIPTVEGYIFNSLWITNLYSRILLGAL